MPSRIFDELLEEQTIIFRNSFSNVSKSLFYDEEKKKLIHAGEFGVYREAIVREFLKFFMPQNFDISTGFVINSNDKVSSQCDIIIYDPAVTPLIKSGSMQRFFPIEPIVGVGEIKSDIQSRQELSEALIKLGKIKQMRDHTPGNFIHKRKSLMGSTAFDPKMHPNDQIVTFLICQRFSFKWDNLHNELTDIYGEIEQRYWHNLLLSVNDGVFLYTDTNGRPSEYPEFIERRHNTFAIFPKEKGVEHIRFFAHLAFTCLNRATVLYPSIADYMTIPNDLPVKGQDSQRNKTYEAR